MSRQANDEFGQARSEARQVRQISREAKDVRQISCEAHNIYQIQSVYVLKSC
jgi:hypothetical protein